MKKNSKIPYKHNDKLKGLKDDILSIFRQNVTQEFGHKEISEKLGKSEKVRDRELVLQAMQKLASEGKLTESRVGRFLLNEKIEYAEGRIDFNTSGNGFLVVEELENDIFIPRGSTGKALQGDTVKAIIYNSDKKPEGEVVEILERKKTKFIGRFDYRAGNNYAFVALAKGVNPDFFIPKVGFNEAKDGQIVQVELTRWPKHSDKPEGKVIEVLGEQGEHNTEIHAILADYGLPAYFPHEVEEAANKIDIRILPEEIAKRRDMRDITTFTIDPVNAQDFDDALSMRKLENGNWEIGVHIADVSHYVTPGSIIDEEAYKRATSIYLVDRVVPMLPEVLSNNVCSLRPNEEKYTFSAVFELDDNAVIQNEWFGRTVTYSDRRFTYEEAQDIIEGQDGEYIEEIRTLDRLAKIMRKARMDKGAISFDKTEVRFELDENNEPIGVKLKISKDSNHLIEEFMLLANKKVSEFVGKPRNGKQRTFIYRVHDDPDVSKLTSLKQFVNTLGYDIDLANKLSITKSLNKLLSDVKGKGEENMVETLAMRTMAKAVYSTESIGHYGLSFEYYSHFTSPIRRYPDVIAHRLLQDFLDNKPPANIEEVEQEAKHSSNMEKLASDAERDSIKYMQVKYMQKYIGETLKGVISGVTEWGIFVEIRDFASEGLVRMRDITEDNFSFDEKNYCAVGKRSGKKYQLGDEVYVKIARANLEKKQLDFELVPTPTEEVEAENI